MKNNSLSPRGGARKFLYSGPKKTTDDDDDDEFTWNFKKNTAKDTGQINGSKSGLDIDEVWNIRRDVNIKAPNKSDSLTFNVNKNYYSRYGNKEKEDSEGLSSNTNTSTDKNQGTVGRSWNMAAGDSHRPFSYSIGINQPNVNEKPLSPRNTSNSSFANYSHLGNMNNNFGSLSSREPEKSMSKDSLGINYGTMSSREPKVSHFPSSKIGQSVNSFPSSGNTNNSFGQSNSGQRQSYSNSVFNGSMFSKNKMPW